jgi:hypothetical protein
MVRLLVAPRTLRMVFTCGLLAAPLASCGGNSKKHSTGTGGSGGSAGTSAQTGGSSGVSGGGQSGAGTSSGGGGGTAGSGGGTAGGASGASGSGTAGNAGSGGKASAGNGGSSGDAGATSEGGAAGEPSTEPAVYAACQYGSGVGRILIAKQEDATCTVLILSMPGSDTLGLDLAPNQGVQSAFRSSEGPNGCIIFSPPNDAAIATSGSGTVARSGNKLNVDVTLQFSAEEQPPSESLSVEGLDFEAACP